MIPMRGGWLEATLVLASIATSFSLGEAAVRFHYFGLDAIEHWGRYSPRHLPATPFGAPDEESDRLARSVSGYFKGASFSTNAFGMRDVERRQAKPRGSWRVAVLGDSFTMGSGVAQDQTFARQLERSLGAALHPRPVEVLNFGIGGDDFQMELRHWRNVVSSFQPDLVLFAMNEGNDLPVSSAAAVPARSTAACRRVRAVSLWSYQRMTDSFLAALVCSQARARFCSEGPERESDVDWLALDRELDDFKRLSSERGEEAVIALIPDTMQLDYAWSRRLRLVLLRRHVRVFDLVARFPAKKLPRPWIYASDAHPNPVWHAEVATLLAEDMLAPIR